MEEYTGDCDRVFLQEKGGGKLGEEESSLYRELTARGYPVTLFAPKQMHRRQLPLNRRSFVAGEMTVVLAAFKQLQIPIPEPNDYPASLKNFLHRRIWKSSFLALSAFIAIAALPALKLMNSS